MSFVVNLGPQGINYAYKIDTNAIKYLVISEFYCR